MSISIFFHLLSTAVCVSSLNLEERNELSRKFKYYFSSVRPSAPENFVADQNGTFFNIDTEIHLLSSVIRERSLHVDAVVSFKWVDERLVHRELSQRIEMPDEFVPWLPSARTAPVPHSQSIFLDPSSGSITWYHRLKAFVTCTTQSWKHPFEHFVCELGVENVGEEILIVTSLRDLRPDIQFSNVDAKLAPYPSSSLLLSFYGDWQSAILSVYLPSILVLFLVFFAQWKRRKVQVLVSTAALVCLLVMISASRAPVRANLLDLWLSGCFLHAAFLLAVDLTLPARRVRYSLAVPIERPEKAPLHILSKANIRNNRVVESFEKLAEKALGKMRDRRVSSELVTACPGETPIQRHVTTASLGERKRLALLVIASSYIIFMTIYLLLAFSVR